MTTDNAAGQINNDDLRITIFDGGVVHFEGTSAQLIAEGLIPKNPKWPDRDIAAAWNTDEFHFSVRRKKPDGMKAPKAAWVTLDNWWLLRKPHNEPSSAELAIKQKMAEIERIKFGHSRAGEIAFGKYWAARQDGDFQAFKQLIPGLTQKRAGRKPKQQQAAN